MNARIPATLAALLLSQATHAALVTDPDDPRNWQSATVGTFAQLYFGSDTLANRQLVVDNELLDDALFDPTGFAAATLITSVGQYSGQGSGQSLDTTGTGSLDIDCCTGPAEGRFAAANAIDDLWFQTSGVVGETVWDLGFQATKAAVFNTVDHDPLPQEAIESTVYLSNDQVTWTQAVVERVWLEGFHPILGIKWDGFVYAVGTGATDTFRYASVTWGGPGALISDGDNEINGILGTVEDFKPPIPEPSTYALTLLGLAAVGAASRRKTKV